MRLPNVVARSLAQSKARFTRIDLDEGNTAFQFVVRGHSSIFPISVWVLEEADQVIVHADCPVKAPEDKRLAIAEFITRINNDAAVGNFTLDFSDGEVAYRAGVDVEGDRLIPALLRNLLAYALTNMDKFFPGILLVLSGVSPVDALAQLEGQKTDLGRLVAQRLSRAASAGSDPALLN